MEFSLMHESEGLYIWEGKWRLPEGFDSKREFKIFLGKSDYIMTTEPHYSKKNGYHFDILQYVENGRVRRKMHCKIDNYLGKSFVKCLEELITM